MGNSSRQREQVLDASTLLYLSTSITVQLAGQPYRMTCIYRYASCHLATLPTWKNKCKCSLEVTAICSVCGVEEEDNFHPFCRCPLARDLWRCMSSVWLLPKFDKIQNSGREWLLQLIDRGPAETRNMILMTLWRS